MGDAQLESTLLRSCLALPKVSFVFRACPPSHLYHFSSDFDTSMRRTLESIIGGPVSDWSCLKSTLPSSRGGLNLRSASRHAPAAFLSSYAASLPLVERILGQHPGPSPHTTAAVFALANAAATPEWLSLEPRSSTSPLIGYRRGISPPPVLGSHHPLSGFGSVN